MRQRSQSGARTRSSRKKQGGLIQPESSYEYGEVTPIARGGVACPFPWKLHEMLTFAHSKQLHDVVCWDSQGTAFSVKNVSVFVKTILPRFFSQTKYASFQRQLNLYGFSRKRPHGPSSYYHECFVRGNPDLVRKMIRCKVKGTGKKRAENEPRSCVPVSISPAHVTPRPEETSSSSWDDEDSSNCRADITVSDESFSFDEAFSKNVQDGDLLFFEGSPFRFLEPSTFESPTNVAAAMPIPLLSSSLPTMPKTRLAPRKTPRNRPAPSLSSEFHNFVL